MVTLTRWILLLGISATLLPAQQPFAATAQQAPAATPQEEHAAEKIRPNYVLGPGDLVTIRAFEVEEISEKPFRIDSEGGINLPILGPVHVGGLTVEQFEVELTQRLKTIVKNPQVTVAVTEYRTESVFVTGYFKTTGIVPLRGRRTLLELLTSVGGLQPNASRKIKVTRHVEEGPIPLPNAVMDPINRVSTVEISIGSLRANLNPAEDILLEPLDTISVDRAEMIYINGEVNKVGALELGDHESLSVTQAITMVGGLGRDALPEKARVLRQVLNTSQRAEIPVNLKKILAGTERDFQLMPSDVLYIPRGGRSVAWGKVGLIAIPVASSLMYVLVQKF